MSDLAELEIALRRDRAYDQLGQTHSHRATREDSLGVIKGRDAIIAAWVNEDASDITIDHDLGDMIAFTVDDGDGGGGAWAAHRWVWREDRRIIREVVIEDRPRILAASPVHPPLGELRAGRGQYAASDTATLPPGFPETARSIANRLHQAWNARAFALYDQPWLPALIRLLPDATFYFEHAVVSEHAIAILWRAIGHHTSGPHPTGKRVRAIGSSVFTGDVENTVIDHAAMAAQLVRGKVDYAGVVG